MRIVERERGGYEDQADLDGRFGLAFKIRSFVRDGGERGRTNLDFFDVHLSLLFARVSTPHWESA